MGQINETGLRGRDAEGVFITEIRNERDSEGVITTTVIIRTSTVDANGDGVRSVHKDITSSLNPGQLVAINAILTKGVEEAALHVEL